MTILEGTIADLKRCLEESETDCESAQETIQILRNELSIKKEKIEPKRESEVEKSLAAQMEEKTQEIILLQSSKEQLQYEHYEHTKNLKSRLHVSERSVKRRNKLINENKVKAVKDME